MFTGIVREVGEVVELRDGRLTVDAPGTAESAEVGHSVSIAGTCLTVVAIDRNHLAFDVVPETIARSSLGGLAAGAKVNVEPALLPTDRLGGHVLQGHVDDVGHVRSLEPEGDGARLTLEAPARLLRYCVEKGSIAVDGVSLTVARLHDDCVEVALVPHTLAATTLGALEPGDAVNLEADILAKYVERLLASRIEA